MVECDTIQESGTINSLNLILYRDGRIAEDINLSGDDAAKFYIMERGKTINTIEFNVDKLK